MITNDIYPRFILDSEACTQLTKIDIDNGSSVYVMNFSSTDAVRFKVQNLITKENPPVGSKRVQIRVERTKILEDGAERTAFVSGVISSPRDGNFTSAEILGLVKAFMSVLSGTVEDSTPVDIVGWTGTTTAGPSFVTRLLNGEV